MRVLSILLIIALTACSGKTSETDEMTDTGVFVGQPFELEDIKPAASLFELITEEPLENIRVEGTVVEVCQTKGCWLTFDTNQDVNFRVTFLDYGFFVPKDLAGQKVVLEGMAWMETKSVNVLRHYAEDAGASDEEIAAITEDQVELLFEASGVYIF